jgi:hypothetical protein
MESKMKWIPLRLFPFSNYIHKATWGTTKRFAAAGGGTVFATIGSEVNTGQPSTV